METTKHSSDRVDWTVMRTRIRVLSGTEIPLEYRDLKRPPQRLYVRGPLPPQPLVGVVGTRAPTAEAFAFAHDLAAELARAGVGIVSGGALGIDAAAHRGTMSAAGRTLLVAPSCLERPYPREHTELFDEIVECGGALLTEQGDDARPRHTLFFRRNELLVALCRAVVVVEAPLRSGARNAALWARRLGRPLFVVPSAPWNPRGGGCIAELKLGGIPLFGAKDVLRHLDVESVERARPRDAGASRRGPPRAQRSQLALPSVVAQNASAVEAPPVDVAVGLELRPRERAIVEALSQEPMHVDTLAERCGGSVTDLAPLLLSLEIRGLVKMHGGGGYVRS